MSYRMQAANSYDGRAWLTMDCRETESGLARMVCTFTSTTIMVPTAEAIERARAEARAGALRMPAADLATFHQRCARELTDEGANVARLPLASRSVALSGLEFHRRACATTTITEFAEVVAASESAKKAQCELNIASFEMDLRRVGADSWVTAEPRPDHCGMITAVTLQRGHGRYGEDWTYTQTRSAGGSTDGLCGALQPGDVQIYSSENVRPVALGCAELR